MAGADVIKKIKQEKIKFIDLRFTDTKGKEQHVTVPASAFDKTNEGAHWYTVREIANAARGAVRVRDYELGGGAGSLG